MTTATALTGRRLTGVSEVILAAVTIGCHRDIDWLYRGAGRFYPEAWERFLAGVPGTPRDGDILAAYARLLEDPDPAVREQAAIDWCAWEDALLSSETQGSDGVFSGREPLARMALVRICAHYFSNGVFLEDRVLIREAGRLAGIPGVLCTAASTSAGRSRPPGSCRGPGRTPSC
jgi:proline iminopeptidase